MPDPLKNGKQNVGAWPYFLQMGIITHKDEVIEQVNPTVSLLRWHFCLKTWKFPHGTSLFHSCPN